MEVKTVNTTLKVAPENINKFEDFLRRTFKVIDFKILPDTEKLYEEDKHFQEIVKKVKVAQRVRDEYINAHNH
jgi:hypothetical protein